MPGRLALLSTWNPDCICDKPQTSITVNRTAGSTGSIWLLASPQLRLADCSDSAPGLTDAAA